MMQLIFYTLLKKNHIDLAFLGLDEKGAKLGVGTIL